MLNLAFAFLTKPFMWATRLLLALAAMATPSVDELMATPREYLLPLEKAPCLECLSDNFIMLFGLSFISAWYL